MLGKSRGRGFPFWAFALVGWSVGNAEAPSTWAGTWNTYWRDGQALIQFEQSEDRVEGTYSPGDGRLEASANGRILQGRWVEPPAEGEFIFLLSEDGQSFVGRFGNGEYWNGERIDLAEAAGLPFRDTTSPREAFRSCLIALNAAAEGNTEASMLLPGLVRYAGPPQGEYHNRHRRERFHQILNLTTLRLLDVPAVAPLGELHFPVESVASGWSYDVYLQEAAPDDWRVVVPELPELNAALAAGLAAGGYPDYAAFAAATRNSPRGVFRRFLVGVHQWELPERRAEALATLELSGVGEQWRAVEGPLAADYLRQIIDRVGYLVWQELPNHPASARTYVHYRNQGGRVAVEPTHVPDGSVTWRFAADTVRDAGEIFARIQALPMVDGLAPPEPLSGYFQLRQRIRQLSPGLLERSLWLENWQWLAALTVVLGSTVLAMLAGAFCSLAGRLTVKLAGGSKAATFSASRGLTWPARLITFGGAWLLGLGYLGFPHSLVTACGMVGSLLVIVGLSWLLLTSINVASRWVYRRHESGQMGVDPIIAALLTGLAKTVVVIGTVLATADTIGVPYEGAIAGLGISGLALAIASRDTVSNFIGAAILLADRPFKRGDLVEVHQHLATVEEVGLRSTRLRTLEDALLVVPNAMLTDHIVNNLGKRRRRRIVLLIGLTYDTARPRLDAFTAGLRELYWRQPLAVEDLYLGLHEFSDSAITVRLWGFFGADTYDAYVEAQHQLMGDIVDLAKAHGVSFAFPTRTVHLAPTSAHGSAASLATD